MFGSMELKLRPVVLPLLTCIIILGCATSRDRDWDQARAAVLAHVLSLSPRPATIYAVALNTPANLHDPSPSVVASLKAKTHVPVVTWSEVWGPNGYRRQIHNETILIANEAPEKADGTELRWLAGSDFNGEMRYFRYFVRRAEGRWQIQRFERAGTIVHPETSCIRE